VDCKENKFVEKLKRLEELKRMMLETCMYKKGQLLPLLEFRKIVSYPHDPKEMVEAFRDCFRDEDKRMPR
jgi:hypothetical protein